MSALTVIELIGLGFIIALVIMVLLFFGPD